MVLGNTEVAFGVELRKKSIYHLVGKKVGMDGAEWT